MTTERQNFNKETNADNKTNIKKAYNEYKEQFDKAITMLRLINRERLGSYPTKIV